MLFGCSDTGGADSGPASPTGTPTEENTGQMGNGTFYLVIIKFIDLFSVKQKYGDLFVK